jgi:hypothetical protein
MRIYVKNNFTTLVWLEFMNILQYKLVIRLCSETLSMLKVTGRVGYLHKISYIKSIVLSVYHHYHPTCFFLI